MFETKTPQDGTFFATPAKRLWYVLNIHPNLKIRESLIISIQKPYRQIFPPWIPWDSQLGLRSSLRQPFLLPGWGNSTSRKKRVTSNFPWGTWNEVRAKNPLPANKKCLSCHCPEKVSRNTGFFHVFLSIHGLRTQWGGLPTPSSMFRMPKQVKTLFSSIQTAWTKKICPLSRILKLLRQPGPALVCTTEREVLAHVLAGVKQGHPPRRNKPILSFPSHLLFSGGVNLHSQSFNKKNYRHIREKHSLSGIWQS